MENYRKVILGSRESYLNACSCTLYSTEGSIKNSGSLIMCQHKLIGIFLLIMILVTLPSINSAQNTNVNSGGDISALVINTPVQSRLVSFTSDINGRNIKLNWVIASEQNITGFVIERAEISKLKSEFSKVGFEEGKGTINTQSNYLFEDKNLQTGKYQYRLKQIDINGKFEYHNLDGTIEVGLPTGFELRQNTPNPLNPTTKIDFALPKDSKVSIKIYDDNRKEVLTLVNDQRTAGFHTVQFYAPDISNGNYFYSFIAESNGEKTIKTEKMLQN